MAALTTSTAASSMPVEPSTEHEKHSRLCSVGDRLGRYNSMEVSVLGDHEAVAEELHYSECEGAVCWHAKGFALIAATVRP